MGVGFIQLLTVGNENKIFNYNPNISFFKIYYRRHTNFFMNNMIINGNTINIDDNNIINKLINFKIPLDGDLLTKSYLYLEYDDYYFEFFAYNSELNSTFNKSILTFYDNFYMKTNNYSIDDIKEILTIKIIYKGKSNLIIMSNVIDNNKIINLIKNQKSIALQKSSSEIYYNMDLTDYFYSFVIDLDTYIKDNDLFDYLNKNINYLKLDYIQIDFPDVNISLRISYYDKLLFKSVTYILYSDNYIGKLLGIRIDNNYIYFSCSFMVDLLKNIIELMYIGVTILNLEILNNKISSSKVRIDKNIYEKILGLIYNKNLYTYVYLQIYNCGIVSESQLTIMENVTFFGNLTNEYYNDLLLSDSNNMMSMINVNDNRMSLNVLTRLLVSLVCFENKISIQEYLNTVNKKKNKNIIENFNYYNTNIDIFSEKLITNFMNPDVLIVSKKCFYILSYSRNIYKYFNYNEYCEPFINKLISSYTDIIINNYLFSSIISSFNNYFNDNTDDFYLQITQLIFFKNLYIPGPNPANDFVYKEIRLNYTFNNFLFNLTNSENNYLDDDLLLNNKLIIDNNFNFNPAVYAIYKNILNLFIVESLTFIDYIINKLSSYVYETDGNLTSLFYNSNSSTSIFPLSSNIYVFTNNVKEDCKILISSNNMYFNKQYIIFFNGLYKNIFTYFNYYYNKYNINIESPLEIELAVFLENTRLITIIKNYYNKSFGNIIELDLNNLNTFLESINNIDYNYIYDFTNINNIIMFELFNYVDTNLYNGTFISFNYNKYSTCNSSIYNTNLRNELNYLKFIFSIGSPLYRLYFLFTFLSKFTIDLISYNYLFSTDDYSNQQTDITNLRNIILSFLITYLYYFNNFDLNKIPISNKYLKYNLDIINNPDYILSNNFICFDQINILNNNDFINKIRDNKSNTFMLIYNSFYFLQKKNNDYQLNLFDLDNIPNICNNIKYNFDDLIIILFLNVLIVNKEFFLNFDNVYTFVLFFFNKYNYDYNKIIELFYKLDKSSISENETFGKILKNDFYQRCYYSTYMLGTLFDNNYNLNVKTINNIFSLTTDLNYTGFDYEFSFKSFNIIQNKNFLSNNNIKKCLQLYLSLFFPIFSANNKIIIQYYINYINSIINYANNNTVYFYKYLISQINFRDCISILNKNIDKFNLVNNSNINLLYNESTIKYNDSNFVKYNFIVILYYYIYFIRKCLFGDIKIFQINDTQSITFGEYISLKYTTNIYYNTINDILNVFKTSSQEIYIDFSILYYSSLIDNKISNVRYSDVITKSTSYSRFEFNNIKDRNELIINTDKLIYVTLNNSGNIHFNSVSNETKNIIVSSTYFNDFYYNLLYNISNKINNILYSVIEGNLYEKNDTIIDLTDKSLFKNYELVKKYNYNSSINILNFSIYVQLYNSYQSNITNLQNKNKNTDKICSLIFKIIKNFYAENDYNYFYAIYYQDENTIKYKKDITNINNELSSKKNNELVENINDFNSIKSLNHIYSAYINILITNSIKFEKEINRIIYYLCTTYLIENSYDKESMKNKLYSKTLYDMVKLYISDDETGLEKIDKNYLKNTSLYSDQSVFQLFNYENLIDNISLTQNYWINEIIEMINTDPNEIDSYYIKFIDFTNYLKLNKINYDLILDDGINVFEYFKNIDNYDELCTLIFDYICLNDYFSPMYIFNNIVFLNQSDEINSKLDIKTDYLKKKISIFLFFNYIILSYLPVLLVKYLEINENIILEYTIDNNIYDVKLKDVLSIKVNMEIIKWSINEIYSFTSLENNFVLNIPSNLSILNEYKDIIYIVKNSKIIISSVPYYNIMSEKFISSYNKIIGYDQVDNNRLINIDFKPTYTNLVANINVIFNNDNVFNNEQNNNNLTYYSLKILNIKLSNIIYDLNNTENNKIYNTSIFTVTSKFNYTKAKINDFNMVYNLLCLLLNNYNITYSNLTNDINNIINNLRIGTNPINDVFENYKGYASELKISLNLTPVDTYNKNENYTNRLFVIRFLTELVGDLNNLSIITPNDYDDIIFTNFKYSYKNFFQKYYSYNYNYYNFVNNEKVIFEQLYNYYKKITLNTNAIKNIKNNNLHLYVWMFIDLINSYIAHIYYKLNNEPQQYIDQLNNLSNLYFKYNYKFRINPNLPNDQNLKIQFEYGKFENKNSYDKLLDYLINYYYYQLFSSQISQVVDFKTNVLDFFKTLNNSLNVDFYYTKNYYNLILKLEIILRFMLYKLSKLYKITKHTPEKIDYEKYITIIKNKLLYFFSNEENIQIFFNLKTIKFISQSDDSNSILFQAINNSINNDIFFKKFSMSIKKLLYWINEYSYEISSFNIWNEYFKNFKLEYIDYSYNQYKILEYNITYDEFTFITYNYINYTILKNNAITNYIDIELTSIYNSIFSYTGYKGKKYIFEPYLINKILYNINIENEEFDDFKKEGNDTVKSVFYNILLLIINTRWGTILYDSVNIKQNYTIRSSILYFNYYYSYLNYLIENNNKITIEEFNFDYYNEIFSELYILYYLILITITCSYINFDSNNNLLGKMLINANTYLQYGNIINSLNLSSNFSIYMDNLNSNIIKDNYIPNFYKKIQNQSIYDNLKYGINNFKENYQNFDIYIINIYNQQYNSLLIRTENMLGYNTFYNIIINTLNNFTANVDLYFDESKITSTVYNTIYSTLNKNISRIKAFIGGEYNNITLNENNINKIYDISNFKSENSQITMFTMIYKNFEDGKIINNIIIIMFYNISFLVWSTLGINILVNSDIILNLFYVLANVINTNIMDYVEYLNSKNSFQNTQTLNDNKYENLEKFFNDMNILLFKNYNNNEFIDAVTIFFQKMIYNYTYTSSNVNLSYIYLLNENLNSKKNIFKNKNNYKIINWTYLIGLCVEYNNSNFTQNFKSILNIYSDENILDYIMNYIFKINQGIINNYGIIKIIDNLELLFDDELISKYSGHDYKIFIDNFQNLNKQKLLNEMLGISDSLKNNNIISGVKPYIKIFGKKTYIIPIKFFFEKYFNAIPQIACMYTKINVNLQIFNTNLFKDSYLTKNLQKSIILTYLDLNFIILERDERKSICKNKIDNLIERKNNYSLIKNILSFDDNINFQNSKYTFIDFDFNLNNLVKELIWTFKLYIDNYEITILKNIKTINPLEFTNTNLDIFEFSNFDFIVNTKFLIDGARRDGINTLDDQNFKTYNAITTILNPYKYNTKTLLNKNYNTYSFGLEPTEFQPNGAFNMSNIKTFTIQIQINNLKLYAYIKNLNVLFNLNKLKFEINLSTFEYNLIRYQSGLSGLLFIQ
jgi:hypothetical protein